jgi:hypothetical protein
LISRVERASCGESRRCDSTTGYGAAAPTIHSAVVADFAREPIAVLAGTMASSTACPRTAP